MSSAFLVGSFGKSSECSNHDVTLGKRESTSCNMFRTCSARSVCSFFSFWFFEIYDSPINDETFGYFKLIFWNSMNALINDIPDII